MIRGVNKNVIEISDTGHECFERAILFVRPDKEQGDQEHLRRQAMEYLSGMKLRPHFYRGRVWPALLKLSAAATVGAAVAALFLR